jgi:hypothetical protein
LVRQDGVGFVKELTAAMQPRIRPRQRTDVEGGARSTDPWGPVGKRNPPLQRAVHKVITEAMRIFSANIEGSAERRRAVMKVYITLFGGISLYAAGVLDRPREKALIAELSAMNARL